LVCNFVVRVRVRVRLRVRVIGGHVGNGHVDRNPFKERTGF